MTIRNIVLLGADGTLGPFVLEQLIASKFNLTVLKRAGSKSPDSYPHDVSIRRVSDDFLEPELIDAFAGQDAVVLTINGSQIDLQKRIARACVQAGVQRLIPADFGSCDSSTARAQALVPLFKQKAELRDYLTTLANEHAAFTWTSLVSGHFLDWPEFLKVHVKEQRIEILDDGDVRASLSTRRRIGEAVARVLQRPDETVNKVCFMQSLCVTQNDLVKAFESATQSKWTVDVLDSRVYEKEQVAQRDRGDAEASSNLVWLLGLVDGNWEKKDGFAMDLLGLENENLEQLIADMVKTQSA